MEALLVIFFIFFLIVVLYIFWEAREVTIPATVISVAIWGIGKVVGVW